MSDMEGMEQTGQSRWGDPSSGPFVPSEQPSETAGSELGKCTRWL